MKSAARLLAVVALTPGLAVASTWQDPSWAVMLEHSDLVLRAKVVEGGEDSAKVQSEAVFFGTAPTGPIQVFGFNNRHWPADARQKESLAKDERYVFFLRATERPGTFAVWTPSAGEFPIEGDQVRADLARTGWPRGAKPRPLAEFEALVRSGLAHRVSGKANRAVCDPQLERLAGSTGLEALQVLTVAGEDTWSEAFTALLSSKQVPVREALATVLGGVAGPKAQRGLEALLGDAAGAVQAAAVQALVRKGPEQAGPVLVAALEKVSAAQVNPKELMDADRTGEESPKVALCQALVELDYRPAIPALQQAYERADAGTVRAIAWALKQLGSGPPASALVKQLEQKDPREALYAIGEQKLTALRPDVEKLLGRTDLDKYALGTVVLVLGEIGDASTAKLLAARYEKSQPEVPSIDTLESSDQLVRALANLDPAGQRKALSAAVRDRTGWDWALAANAKARAERVAWSKKTCETALGTLGLTVENTRCIALAGLGKKGAAKTVMVTAQLKRPWPRTLADSVDLLVKALGVPGSSIGLAYYEGSGGEAQGSGLVREGSGRVAIESVLVAVKNAPHAADAALLSGLLDSGVAGWAEVAKEVREAAAEVAKRR